MSEQRLFIAVDLAINVVERLVLLQNEWASRFGANDARIRWVDPENIHVTLKFLGENDPVVVPLLEAALQRLVRPLFPFEVSCQRIGAFPEPTNPRILWAGLDAKGAEVMSLLQLSIEQDIASLGFPPDQREFKPHVTLGRVKSRTAADMSGLVEELGSFDFGSSYIKDIALYESKLTPDGARYTVLNRFSLGEN